MISFIEGIEKYTESLDSKAPRWFMEMRKENLSRLEKLELPTVKDEDWKYTNITPVTKRKYHFPETGELKENDHLQAYCDTDEINIVFINGIFSSSFSTIKDMLPSVSISTLQEALHEDKTDLAQRLKTYDHKEASPFVVLNQALMQNGVYIQIAGKTIVDKLIHIIHVTSTEKDEIITTPRTIISLEKSCEATILETHLAFSDEVTYFANALTDIFLEENAVLHYCKAQKESTKAFHVGTTRIWQERRSNFNSFSMTAGGLLSRNDLDVIINGEGAETSLNGLYAINHKQHMDNHTSIDHRYPNCTSKQFYKGLLNGQSRAVFNGKIIVRSAAQLTNSYQLNKNLILGTDCRVDTKPQLEIFADDVKCSHGATIGQLNEDELFYLQTRSIPKKAAVKMLARGFVNDILGTIRNESICRKLNILLKPTPLNPP